MTAAACFYRDALQLQHGSWRACGARQGEELRGFVHLLLTREARSMSSFILVPMKSGRPLFLFNSCSEASAQVWLVRGVQERFISTCFLLLKHRLPSKRAWPKGWSVDGRTVQVGHGCPLVKHFLKHDKWWVLAGLNESFPGAEWKSRTSSCSIFVTNGIGQHVPLNAVLWFDSKYNGSRTVLISNNRENLIKPKLKALL